MGSAQTFGAHQKKLGLTEIFWDAGSLLTWLTLIKDGNEDMKRFKIFHYLRRKPSSVNRDCELYFLHVKRNAPSRHSDVTYDSKEMSCSCKIS